MQMTPRDIASMEGDVAKITLAMVMASLQTNVGGGSEEAVVEVPTRPATPASEVEGDDDESVEISHRGDGLHSFFSKGGALAPGKVFHLFVATIF